MNYDDIPIEVLLLKLEKLQRKTSPVCIPLTIEDILPKDAPSPKGPFPEPLPNKRVIIIDI